MKRKKRRKTLYSSDAIGKECELPICRYCEDSLCRPLRRPLMPRAALTNDLMIFYSPRILYEQKVTTMELICASVCLTTMISFTLEKKHRKKEKRLFDQEVHMQRHTIGTRGNATTFLMPWEEILRRLSEVEEREASDSLDLPNSGKDLVRWVQVLLKTSGDESIDEMKGLVHQASVRADVVVSLIEELKNRGHRAYKNVDMGRVRLKAKNTLPTAGIPTEIMHLIKIKADDDTLDKVQIQKEATPIPGRCQNAEQERKIFATLSPNAVVCERSAEDGVDVITQQATTFENIGRQLLKTQNKESTMKCTKLASKPAKIALTTDNRMVDQFQPWCKPPS